MGSLRLPLIVFAFPGTFDKYVGVGSKYKYTLIKREHKENASDFVARIRSTLKASKGNSNVFIVPLKSDAMQAAFNEGLDFAAAYPESDSCAYIQDVMDEQGYSDDEVAEMIANWNTEVKDKTYRQLPRKVVVIEEDKSITDDVIDDLLS